MARIGTRPSTSMGTRPANSAADKRSSLHEELPGVQLAPSSN
jgi:hypothetical protein